MSTLSEYYRLHMIFPNGLPLTPQTPLLSLLVTSRDVMWKCTLILILAPSTTHRKWNKNNYGEWEKVLKVEYLGVMQYCVCLENRNNYSTFVYLR